MELNVLGTSKVALAVCKHLIEKGHRVCFVVSRSKEKAGTFVEGLGVGDAVPVTYQELKSLSGVILFAVPDSMIQHVYQQVKDKCAPGSCLIHFSGFHSSKIFIGADELGFSRASMHPNLSFADPDIAYLNLPSCIFGLEGDESGMRIAIELVEDISGKYVILSEEGKVAYHLAAVICSNFVVGLAALAEKIYSNCGVGDFRGVMSNLIFNVTQNISAKGVKESLTGPVARGDWQIVEKEREVFEKIFPQFTLLYDNLVEVLKKLKEGRL